MATLYSPRIVTDNLALYLDAGNRKSYPGTGTSWFNLTDTTKVNVLTNGPTFDGANGGSIVYDGIDDTSSIGSLGLSGLTQLTINVWYYSNVNASTALVRSLDGLNSFILHYRGAGFYLIANDGTVSDYLGWQTTIPFNRWMMLTGTWNGSVMKLYQNGVKQANERAFTGGTTGTLRNINSIILGYNFNTFQPWTNGKVAICSLYTRALTDSEVLQNFNATRSRFGV